MLVLLVHGVGMGGTGVVGPGYVPGLPSDFNGVAVLPAAAEDRGGCTGRKRRIPAEPPERGQATGGRRNRFGGESHR